MGKVKSWVWIVIFMVVLFIVGMSIAYPLIKGEERLKVYQPSDVNPKLVDKSKQRVTKDHTVADFSLTDQTGKTVTPATFDSAIYVADFFFTTCPSICPKMSKQMARLQDVFKEQPRVMLLSHSVTPKIDSVPRLARYAEKYNANSDKWKLVTGDKKHIYNLARKSYFAVLDEGDGGKQDFIHTENFVLIDPERRIRGFYDGTSPKEVGKLIDDIRILMKEYDIQ